MVNLEPLKNNDPDLYELIVKETGRQNCGLELIPSENFVSKAVLEAMGSVLTNKYAEGYPGKRYYGGNQYIDQIEQIAIDRAKSLFGAEHANVQPNSGSPANMAVYFALMEAGDKLMGLELSQGGHLTHGSPVNFSGKLYNATSYSVDKETEIIDMDLVRKQAEKEKPKILLSSTTAYPRELDFTEFAEIAKDVGALSMADIAHIAGLIIGKVHQDPFPFTDVVTTTTHKTLRGPRSGLILCKEEYGKAIDKAVFPGMQGGPHEHIIAAKAVCFKEAASPEFSEYAGQIVKNAKRLSESLIEYGFRLVTGGTDNHLLLIDMTNKGLSGKEAQNSLDEAGITTNRNTIPFEPRSPFDPSGLRLGTPAITSRGMKESEMEQVARWINKVIENHSDSSVKEKVKEEIKEFCQDFPLYP
ncbi:MAG: serine hydroxymethyltransferase [Euryarchaeota archaeon]|nr:serine hydroxymethyltransferase [Euryarchaeota archaeon]HIK01167.1 serine hydroxymethyltransferase [Candidatus Undinarchaeales archaeon ERR594346 U_76725]|tara:strand:- start:71652 stop:72896 length:1245 start_codon:yes stop_codon:yes gene_type:complete